MFKRLKEKKELEEKTGLNPNQRSDENDDNFGVNSEDFSLNNSFDYNSDDSIAGKETNSGDNTVVNNNNLLNNILDTNDSKTAIDLLNEQILRLKSELISVKNLNTSLESQVRQLSDEKQVLNQQIVTKTEECLRLNLQIKEYQSIGGEKDDLLLRNAELSSRCQQLSQELDAEKQDRMELSTKCDSMGKQIENHTNNDKLLVKLNESVVKLEQTVTEKNKTIKLQQQRLHDMKKTFLQNQSNTKGVVAFDDDKNAISGDERSPRHQIRDSFVDNRVSVQDFSDVSSGRELNFQYLRNVVFKYMVSSDYEVAIHLVRAISVLLNFNKEEEQLIKETIAWKMSWIAPLMAPKPTLHSNRKQ